MGHLAETVHQNEYGCDAVRWGQAGDKAQGDVGPRTMWNRECLKETSRSLVGWLVLVADWTGVKKRSCVLLQG